MSSILRRISQSDSTTGILLLFSAAMAFFFANSSWDQLYLQVIHNPISMDFGFYKFSTDFHTFVNDFLMVIFFYYVGLEIKKEIKIGELSDPKKSSFAILAAIGGMVVPALVYTVFNAGTPAEHGWGIPMATDIAFAVGVLALLGPRVPVELKVFLLALAIVDDLGAVLVIALFYTESLSPLYLLLALLPLAFLYFANKKHRVSPGPAIFFGAIVWFFILKSGVHATISGVLLAFLTPLQVTLEDGRKHRPLEFWAHRLQPIVALLIMPIFAFFNAGVGLKETSIDAVLSHHAAQGVLMGLFFGKPLGIFLVCYLSTKLGISKPPKGVSWLQIFGVGILAGIGFTMSLFVSGLSFSDPSLELYSKTGIMSASILAAITGVFVLMVASKIKPRP